MPSLESASFRTAWKFAPGTPEYILFSHLESIGYGKQVLVVDALMNYYYPDLAYQKGNLSIDEQKLIRRQILSLESRLNYFKKLLGNDDLESIVTTEFTVNDSSLSNLSSSNQSVANVELDEDEDEDEYLYDSDGI